MSLMGQMRSSRVVQAQIQKLMDLLIENGVVDGKLKYIRTSKLVFWKRIATHLNAIPGGACKNPWKWCKTWADFKAKTKKKAIMLQNKKINSLGRPSPPLTNLERRVLNYMNIPYGRNDSLNMEMPLSKVDDDEFHIDYLDEEEMDDINNTSQSHNDHVSDGDNKTVGFSGRLNRCQFSKIENIDIDGEKVEEQSSDEEYRIEHKEERNNKGKLMLERYKIQWKSEELKLQRDRMEQKSEEIRLRAIELKLKGEELKIKENEMNKINHLTNIEEEKLKCFKEISSSLKLLLGRMNPGNHIFQNGES